MEERDEEEKDERPAPKKKKKRKKRPEAKAKTKATTKATTKAKTKAKPSAKEKKGLGNKLWLILLAIGVVELWAFGSRGHINLCVGREGVHDFSLVGQDRNDENTRRYPSCEKRVNIGITSHYDEANEDAAINACRRATILRPKAETIACVIKEAGWQHQVETKWCPPWHDHYYKRLFWFAFTE